MPLMDREFQLAPTGKQTFWWLQPCWRTGKVGSTFNPAIRSEAWLVRA